MLLARPPRSALLVLWTVSISVDAPQGVERTVLVASACDTGQQKQLQQDNTALTMQKASFCKKIKSCNTLVYV